MSIIMKKNLKKNSEPNCENPFSFSVTEQYCIIQKEKKNILKIKYVKKYPSS